MSSACFRGYGDYLLSFAERTAQRYKEALMAADEPRRSDLDGRGALSEQRLTELCLFFLDASVDQVEFMESLVQPSELLRRMKALRR